MKKIPCEKSVCDKEGEGKNQFANLSHSCDEEGFGELISRFEPACRTLLCCFSRLEYFQEEKKEIGFSVCTVEWFCKHRNLSLYLLDMNVDERER